MANKTTGGIGTNQYEVKGRSIGGDGTGTERATALADDAPVGNPNDGDKGVFVSIEDQDLEPCGTGRWMVADSTPRWNTDYGYHAEMSMGAGSFQSGRIEAAVEMYQTANGDARDDVDAFAASESKVTVLVVAGGDVEAWEGTAMIGAGGAPILKMKSSRTNAMRLTAPVEVLAIRYGMGHQQELAAGFKRYVAMTPELTKPSFDSLPESGEEPESTIGAAYIVRGPRFDNTDPTPRGCVFFATDYDRENDIVNGYFYANAGYQMESEHGSMYGADIKRTRAGGQVAGFDASKGVQFRDVMERGDDSLTAMMAFLRDPTA